MGDYTITTVPGTLSTEAAATPDILHVDFVGGGFHLAFGTKVGLTYTVEYEDSLTDPFWTPLETVVGDGLEFIVADPGPLPAARFYRVRMTVP